MQQQPNQSPIPQPEQPSVDQKIAAITNEVYTFEHTKQKKSPWARFKSMPRTKKVLLLIGTCFLVFVIVVISLSLMPRGADKTKGTNTVTTTGSSDITKSNLPEYETADANNDGIIDAYDVIATSDPDYESGSDSQDSAVSWWQKILNAGRSSSSGTNSGGTNYDESGVAFEDNEGSSLDIDDSSDDIGDYIDETEEDSEANDMDTSAPIDIPIEAGPTASMPVPAGGATVTFASWNTLFSNSTGNVGKGATAMGKKADVIGFQELHRADRKKEIRDTMLCSSCDFSGYFQNYTVNGSSPGSVAIIWRKDRFKVVKSGYYKVSDRQTIDTHNGITGNQISGKWITWVLLKDKRTNAQFYFLNTHTVASVESKGKPVSGENDRLKLYTRHMDVLTQKIKSFEASGLPVFITGDFNVNYRYDHKVKYKNFPFTRLGAVGVHSDYQRLNLVGVPSSQGSHGSGNRIIDYVWYANNSNVYPMSESISTNRYGSDHYPVYFTANVR